MATGTRSGGRPTDRAPLLSSATIAQMRWWSGRRWRAAALGFVVAFVLIGELGETLPPASVGRMYPVLWWNWVALAACAVLSSTLLLRLRDTTGCGCDVRE